MNRNDTAARIAHVFSGTFVHSTPRAAVEILQNRVLGVDDEGKVCFIVYLITIYVIWFWFTFEDKCLNHIM